MKNIRDKFPYSKDRIFLDNSASTQKPLEVIDTMSNFYKYEYAPVHRGIYQAGEISSQKYESAREIIANFLHCESEEVIFTRGTTESINFAASAWATNNLNAGDEIILTELEHNSNLAPWIRLANQKQIILKFIKINNIGELDLDQYLQILSHKTKLVSFTLGSNSLGTILTPEQIDIIISNARKFGAKILLDAAQVIGYKPVHIDKLKPDFLAFSGHKMFGPTGIGVLYISKDIQNQVEPYQVGGGMLSNIYPDHFEPNKAPHKYEAGTPAIVQAIGLGAAVKFIEKNINFEELNKHFSELSTAFIDGANQIPKIRILGPIENLKKHGHLVSFLFDHIHAHDIAAYLDYYNKIEIRAGLHCSHIAFKNLGIHGSARISFHAYNTIEEINILLEALSKLSKQF